MKKKGFVLDLVTFGIVLFAMAIVVVSMSYVWNAINDGWQNSTTIPTESKQIIATQQSRFVSVWDGWFVIAVIGYAIALIILSFSIRSHPVFAMLGLILMVIFGMIGLHLANAYDAFGSSASIAPTANAFTVTNFVMRNLPKLVIVFGVLFIVILFGKNSANQPSI